jgi:hypothetical protein
MWQVIFPDSDNAIMDAAALNNVGALKKNTSPVQV